MAKKLIVQTNFVDSMHREDGAKQDPPVSSKEWQKGEEYTGSDDVARLQAEGLIAEEAAERKPSKRGGRKTAEDLADGEAIKTSGEAAGNTRPADGSPSAGNDADGEEVVEDDEPTPPKPAKAPKAKGKGSEELRP